MRWFEKAAPGGAGHWAGEGNGRCQGSLVGGRRRILQENRAGTKENEIGKYISSECLGMWVARVKSKKSLLLLYLQPVA